MKTIKDVLEELVIEVTHKFYVEPWDKDDIDQALKEIKDILDGAKPEENYISPYQLAAETLSIGFNNGVKEYQSNIEKVIGL